MNVSKKHLIEKLEQLKEDVKRCESIQIYLIEEHARIAIEKRNNAKHARKYRADIQEVRKELRRMARLERNSQITTG